MGMNVGLNVSTQTQSLKFNKSNRFFTRVFILAVGAGLLLTAILQNFQMYFIEAFFYDLLVKTKGQLNSLRHQQPIPIVIIKIDDRTVEKLNEYAPLGLNRHIELLKVLERANPKAIAYLTPFNETGSVADQFVQIVQKMNYNNIPVILGTEVSTTGEVVPPYPLSKLKHKMAVITTDGKTFSEDKVVRRAIFSVYDEPTLHVKLAELINSKTSSSEYNGIYSMNEVDAKYFYIDYFNDTRSLKNNYFQISAIDLISAQSNLKLNSDLIDQIKDKIVLIGSETTDNSSDFIYTPYSSEAFVNSKLVVHANILSTLIKDSAIRKMSASFDHFFSFVLTVVTIFIVFNTSPFFGVLFTLFCGVGLVALAVFVFILLGYWMPLAHPLAGIFSAYYIFVPYRLVLEYKKRSQFQRKHEVLLQVEELKSNFMNLITHDLKTPVARIQGMAEILNRTNADPKIVNEILSSTDELNRFVSSILELAKIESDKVSLNKQSKDINRVIEECANKFAFNAKEKNIEIKVNLEPLFPIKIDVALISKVIANLIDNAIKYSPDNSLIEIYSSESDRMKGYIEIRIIDHGYGISEKDLENIFSKFYRPKKDLMLKVKGTGLGLYLSKYFVELHKGTLEVSSEEGKGSCFCVFLPQSIQAVANKGEIYV